MESAETFAKRMERATFEMSFENKFDVTLVNKELEDSFAQARKLVGDFLNK